MDKIFVAQWFDERDSTLVGLIDRVLYSHGIRSITGHVLGGDALDDAIKERIENSDCLIALVTRRQQLNDGRWMTHPWVTHEFAHAKSQNKDAIALVEVGVVWEGPYQAHEFIQLDRDRPSDALLTLSNTVGMWKEKAGKTLKLQVLPNTLAEKLELESDVFKCSYRLVEQGNFADWCNVSPVPEPGGVFFYIKGVQDRQLVEVKVSANRETWKSPATPQLMPVILKELV